jgi:hypothetical protein
LKLWRTVGRGTWVLAGITAVALWVLVLLVDALFFLMSYTQPVDTNTGQDWDRAMSWVFLGMLVAASALAIAVVRLPVTYRRVRASARSNVQGVRAQSRSRSAHDSVDSRYASARASPG